MSWIDASERLPDNDDDVLVIADGVRGVGYRSRNEPLWLVYYPHGVDEPETVTHWQPMPALPEGMPNDIFRPDWPQ